MVFFSLNSPLIAGATRCPHKMKTCGGHYLVAVWLSAAALRFNSAARSRKTSG